MLVLALEENVRLKDLMGPVLAPEPTPEVAALEEGRRCMGGWELFALGPPWTREGSALVNVVPLMGWRWNDSEYEQESVCAQ